MLICVTEVGTLDCFKEEVAALWSPSLGARLLGGGTREGGTRGLQHRLPHFGPKLRSRMWVESLTCYTQQSVHCNGFLSHANIDSTLWDPDCSRTGVSNTKVQPPRHPARVRGCWWRRRGSPRCARTPALASCLLQSSPARKSRTRGC